MNLAKGLLKKLSALAIKSNEEGIPLPLLRDNRTDSGSYTLTMFWVAFNVAVLTLFGKITKLVGAVDYNDALWLLGITGSFYMGKKFTGDGKSITIDKEASPSEPAKAASEEPEVKE